MEKNLNKMIEAVKGEVNVSSDLQDAIINLTNALADYKETSTGIKISEEDRLDTILNALLFAEESESKNKPKSK